MSIWTNWRNNKYDTNMMIKYKQTSNLLKKKYIFINKQIINYFYRIQNLLLTSTIPYKSSISSRVILIISIPTLSIRNLASLQNVEYKRDESDKCSGRKARCEGGMEIFLAAQQLTSLSCFTSLASFLQRNFLSSLRAWSPNKIDRWLWMRCLVDHSRLVDILDTLPPKTTLLAAKQICRIEALQNQTSPIFFIKRVNNGRSTHICLYRMKRCDEMKRKRFKVDFNFVCKELAKFVESNYKIHIANLQ